MYKNRIKNEKISRILSILKFLEHIPYTWSIKNSTNTTPHHTTEFEYTMRIFAAMRFECGCTDVPIYQSAIQPTYTTPYSTCSTPFNGKSNVSCEYEYEYEYGLDFWAIQINRLGGLACVFYQNFPIFLSSNRLVVTVWFAAKTRLFNE